MGSHKCLWGWTGFPRLEKLLALLVPDELCLKNLVLSLCQIHMLKSSVFLRAHCDAVHPFGDTASVSSQISGHLLQTHTL